MDIAGTRDIVLGDHNAEEYDHFGKVAFRIKPNKPGAKPGRTFMTLWLNEGHAVLMLDPEQQTELMAHHSAEFEAHPSKWGAKGATIMHLAKVTEKQFRRALSMAIKNATR